MNSLNKTISLSGNNQILIENILQKKNCENFFIKRKIGKKIFYFLVTNTKVKKVYLTKSVYKQISKKNIDALKSLNIEVKIVKSKRGKPKKINLSEIKKIKKYETAKRKFQISKSYFYKIKK